jgi:cardiolipin synthase
MPIDLPNLLTLSRVAAIPVLAALLALDSAGGDLAACGLFCAAAITDYLDGRIARHRGRISAFGRMLDPIADKLLVGAALFLLAADGRLSPVGVYAALLVLMREIVVSGLREYLAGEGIGMPVSWLAKWKTAAQMVALVALLLGDRAAVLVGLPGNGVSTTGEIMLALAAVLTLITGWEYFLVGLRHMGGAKAAR